jgi:hypothetical protein
MMEIFFSSNPHFSHGIVRHCLRLLMDGISMRVFIGMGCGLLHFEFFISIIHTSALFQLVGVDICEDIMEYWGLVKSGLYLFRQRILS